MIFSPKKVYTVETLGSESLRKVAEPIPTITQEIRELAQWMGQVVYRFDGIGLAAPQIGVNKRLVVLALNSDSLSDAPTPGELQLLPRMPMAILNPEILSYGEEKGWYDEGCLSVPDIFAPVERPLFCRLRAQTLQGDIFEVDCGGLLARCVQHELDHLEGKLFIDRVEGEDREAIAKALQKLQKFGEKHHFQKQIKVR